MDCRLKRKELYFMSVATASADYQEIISLLPSGSSLRVEDVSWEEYEQLLDDLGAGYAARISYDEGRMEIEALASIHEKNKGLIHRLIMALSDELDIDIESFGSTTFRKKLLKKGAEPDDCFYIQNAASVIGKEDLDLKEDPPPDLILEIDRTSASLNKFPIYASFGVPEIWRVYKGKVRIFLLDQNTCDESSVSRAFPFLSNETVSEFLAKGIAEGERTTAKAFREWLSKHQDKTF
jgi:Uma2 family endonuclease